MMRRSSARLRKELSPSADAVLPTAGKRVAAAVSEAQTAGEKPKKRASTAPDKDTAAPVGAAKAALRTREEAAWAAG